MDTVIIGRVVGLSAVTVAVAIGFVSLPALGALAVTTVVLGAFELSRVFGRREMHRLVAPLRGADRFLAGRPGTG